MDGLTEQLEKFSLGNEETTLNQNTLILNMLDYDTLKELLKETMPPTKALEIAIHIEMGAQNHQRSIRTQTPTLNQQILSPTSKDAIATRTTSKNEKTSIADQLFLKTNNTPAIMLIVVSVEAIIIAKLALQRIGNVIIAKLWDILSKMSKTKKSQAEPSQRQQKTSIMLTQTRPKMITKNL